LRSISKDLQPDRLKQAIAQDRVVWFSSVAIFRPGIVAPRTQTKPSGPDLAVPCAVPVVAEPETGPPHAWMKPRLPLPPFWQTFS